MLHVAEFPRPGAFTSKLRRLERPGGSAANVAQAVATAGVDTGLVTLLGNDDLGRELWHTLQQSALSHVHVREVDGETSHVLVVVDAQGDRTIIGLAGDELDSLHLDDVPLLPGDIVTFVTWSLSFRVDLARAKAAGCVTVVGLGALLDPEVDGADIAFGSTVDVPADIDPSRYTDRFPVIVMTRGAEGATQYTPSGEVNRPALPSRVVDTTGAGDAFLAGYLSAYAHGSRDAATNLQAGARWAARMVSIEASIPPAADTVPGLTEMITRRRHPVI